MNTECTCKAAIQVMTTSGKMRDDIIQCPLCAAAPEMLSWIKCCTAAYDDTEKPSPLMQRGWNVIARAEGETP